MGVLIVDGTDKYQGKVWQKYSPSVGTERVIVFIEESSTGSDPAAIAANAEVYSRQLDISKAVVPEYTGIEDIVFTNNNTIFGCDRSVFKTLNCTVDDLNGGLLTETKLRDMADHIEVSCADDSSVKLVASNHKIISTVEKQMYQFKEYTIDSANSSFNLGRKDVIFDTYTLYKDKYSRNQNVVLLDTDKIGELVRKDGSEMYEGIMTKYADMYIDAFKSHAGFINAAENIA